MSEIKHTPGPWRYSKCPCGHRACDQHTISVQGNRGFNEPDARLIVAAPDLLAALKLCVIERSEWLESARAAIAKAEGQS